MLGNVFCDVLPGDAYGMGAVAVGELAHCLFEEGDLGENGVIRMEGTIRGCWL